MADLSEPDSQKHDEVPMKYVAFCDVLGFSHAVEHDFDSTIAVYKDFVRRVNAWPFPDEVKVRSTQIRC